MSKTRFTKWIVLGCIGTLAACTSGEDGTTGNTEMNVIIPNGFDNGSPDPDGNPQPAPVDIQTVEYTIHCNGNSDTFLDNAASFPDAVTLNGNLEVNEADPVEAPGINPSSADVFQGFMDLPPGNCSAEFRARDNDGEVICSDREGFTVTAGSNIQVNLVMYCGLSFQAPVGMADLAGVFSFNVANFCPDLIVLNCLETFPAEPTDVDGNSTGPATTDCEVRLRDGDHTCGTACDPQTCEADGENGLACTQPGGPDLPSGFSPGADPGTTTTVNCAGASMDCNLNGTYGQTTCTYTGDALGTLAVNTGNVPNTPAAFGVSCEGQLAGAPVTCTAVTTDGDLDCNKTKVVSFDCPGANFCDTAAGACDDGNECTDNDCDRIAQACANTPVPAGNGPNCTPAGGGLGECDGTGFCATFGCTSNADCFPGSDCESAATCNLGNGACEGRGPINEGGACNSDTGLCEATGTTEANPPTSVCITTVCRAATEAVDCDDANDCTIDTCDETTTAGVCINTPDNGAVCDVGGNPGTCADDVCVLDPFDPDPITRLVPMACSNNLAPQLSDLLFELTVDPTVILADATFDATITGTLQFDQAFLQASIGFVPGLTSADVVGARASVGARGNVVDSMVPGDNTVGNQQTVVPLPGSNCTTGAEPFCNLPIPQVPNPGFPGTGQPCGGDADCLFNALGSLCVANQCTAASNPLPCGPGAPGLGLPEECPLLGVPSGYHPEVDGTGGQQCVANAASPTGFFCENFACTGPGDATTPPAIIPAGASCFANADCSGANYGQLCDTTAFECIALDCSDGSCNVCTNIVVAGLAVPYGPTPGPRTFTAGSIVGNQLCFDYSGDATIAGGPNLNLINVDAGGIAVALSCQGGMTIATCPDTCPVDQANIDPNPFDSTVLPCFDVQ